MIDVETCTTEVFDILKRLQNVRAATSVVRMARNGDVAADIAIRYLIRATIKSDLFDKLPVCVRAYAIDIIDPDNSDIRLYPYDLIRVVLERVERHEAVFS
jgi:hypothetical protein